MGLMEPQFLWWLHLHIPTQARGSAPPSRQVLRLPRDSLAFPRRRLRWLVAEWSSRLWYQLELPAPTHPRRELQAALENNQIYSL